MPERFSVCFLGSSRYSRPLDSTSAKKFQVLSKIGNIAVVAFASQAKPAVFEEHARFFLLPNFRSSILRYLEFAALAWLLALWCIVRFGVQTIVAQGPYEGCCAAWTKIAARIFGRRIGLIVESHGDFEVAPFLYRKSRPLSLVLKPLLHQAALFALHHADALRAVSTSTEIQLLALQPAKPIFRFPAWTDIERFHYAGERRHNAGKRVVLFVGTLARVKGVHNLVEAFRRIEPEVPDVTLKLVGDFFDPTYVREIMRHVTEAGLASKVSFIGRLSQPDVAREMVEADVMVLPSVSEAFPRVVVEAMYCGTPVIATNVGAIPEIIRDGETGFLVPPNDPGALAARLLWLLSHPEDIRPIADRARASVPALYSGEKYVSAYEEVFRCVRRAPEF